MKITISFERAYLGKSKVSYNLQHSKETYFKFLDNNITIIYLAFLKRNNICILIIPWVLAYVAHVHALPFPVSSGYYVENKALEGLGEMSPPKIFRWKLDCVKAMAGTLLWKTPQE